MRTPSCDVVIVGAGVIGSSIVFRLRGSGLRVSWVDPTSKPEGSASLAAGAMLGAFGEITAASAGHRDEAETSFRLAGAEAYPGFLREVSELCGKPVWSGRGTFVIANPNGRDDLENLKEIERVARNHRQQVERVNPADIPGYRPHQQFHAQQALFLADEGFVSSAELITALHAAIATDDCVTRINGRVEAVLTTQGAVTGVRLEDGSHIRAPSVVLAAGALLQEIVEKTAPLRPSLPALIGGKGSSLILQTDVELPFVIRTPNRDFACGTHVVPRPGRNIYVGATNRISKTPGADGGATAGEILGLLSAATHEVHTGLRTASVIETRYGARPLSADRYPIIGGTSIDGLLVAGGTYRNGIVMAPIVSALIVAELTGAPGSFENPFRPTDRRPDPANMRRLISSGASDLVSFIQEPHGSLPFNRQQELQDFLEILLEMALLDPEDLGSLRSDALGLFSVYPLTEVVPILFYKYHAYANSRRAHARVAELIPQEGW